MKKMTKFCTLFALFSMTSIFSSSFNNLKINESNNREYVLHKLQGTEEGKKFINEEKKKLASFPDDVVMTFIWAKMLEFVDKQRRSKEAKK